MTKETEAARRRPPELAARVYRAVRRTDRIPLLLLDAGVVLVAYFLSFVAGYEGSIPSDILPGIPALLLGIVVIHVAVYRRTGLYGPVWRYASVDEALRLVAGVAISSLLSAIALLLVRGAFGLTIPFITTPTIASLLVMIGCGGVRFQARLFALERGERSGSPRVRTLIIGTGDTAVNLSRELAAEPGTTLVGFATDDPTLVRRQLRGSPVIGTIVDLERLCRENSIERVLIAPDGQPGHQVQQIVARALGTDAQVKVVPRTTDRVNGTLVSTLRDIDVTDLLGRKHAPIDSAEVGEWLRESTVLVTGAGGSIGSEIALQVARYRPRRLLILDRDESLLHDLILGPLEGAVPVLADICDTQHMRSVLANYRPDVIFHAAALKHVPMLELHPLEAIRTNLVATRSLVELAAEFECSRFVAVSTDKAASPVSVMGATKRATELVVHEIGRRNHLPYTTVRFGNVLGSRGSVVPTFLRQILDGGPVTVTSPNMTRFFMTTSEAVSLVLQAAVLSDERQTYLLDMGEPVAIVDLANQMIRMAGLRPGIDIEVRVVGARPGERLHEQLYDESEVIGSTRHPSIRTVESRHRPTGDHLLETIDELALAVERGGAHAAVGLLEQLLTDAGVPCQLELDRPAEVSLLGGGKRVERRLAALGGRPAFAESLPFVRPSRPLLERVVARYQPSYRSGMLTNGPLVRELEECIAERLGGCHVVAVSSCTAGLMLAAQALTDGRPGPVVMPGFTFSASAHAVAWNGLTPLFTECDPATFQLDMAEARAALSDAALLMPTHVFGAPAEPEEAEALGLAFGVPVLFDAAHGLGGLRHDRPLGTFGDAEVFSLTPTKVLVAGEGGLVATPHAEIAERLRWGRDYGNPGDYDTQFVGLNGRLSEFNAALALESLVGLDDALDRRREIASRYAAGFAEIPGVRCQLVDPHDRSTYKDFTIAIDPEVFGIDRDQLVGVLAAEGVDTRNYFDPPVHRQRAYASLEPVDLAVTDRLSSEVVSLPIYPDLSLSDVDTVTDLIDAAHRNADQLRDDAVPRAVAARSGRWSNVAPIDRSFGS